MGYFGFFQCFEVQKPNRKSFCFLDLNVGCEGKGEKEEKEEKEEKGVGMDSKSNSVRQLFDEADETATIT